VIYSVENGMLITRSRADGQVLSWFDLSMLAWPTAESDAGRRRRWPFSLFGRKRIVNCVTERQSERFEFTLVLNHDQFVVFRTGVSGSGCVIMIGSRDWVAIKRDSMKMRFGQGELFAATRNAVLVSNRGNALLQVSGGQSRDISKQIARGTLNVDTPWRDVDSNSNRFCAFKFKETRETKTGQLNLYKVAVYDGERQKAIAFEPLPRHAIQVKWENTARHLARFSECGAIEAAKGGTNWIPFSLWVEFYKTDGKPVGELTLPYEYELPGDYSRGMRFCGITTDGCFVFMEYAYAHTSESAYRTLAYTRLVVMDPAVPRITRLIDLSSGGKTADNVRKNAQTDTVIQILGDGEVEKMDEPEADRELIVRAISVKTGKELWRHSETIRIHKIE
jgi:hypothetical protein